MYKLVSVRYLLLRVGHERLNVRCDKTHLAATVRMKKNDLLGNFLWKLSYRQIPINIYVNLDG